MPENRASHENQTDNNVEEVFFVEQEFQIDKITLLAIASILIALIVLAQILSPAPIWAIIIIVVLFIFLLWTVLIIISLLNSKKITINDIKKSRKIISFQAPEKRVPRPVRPHPRPGIIESQPSSEPLYTDYIFTEEGWKSAEETCAICKKPYAEFKHGCGAIFHRNCLNQYFSSLSDDDNSLQLCPHCYEPLIQEKPEAVKIKWHLQDLPEEEIEDTIEPTGLEIKRRETIIDKIDIDWVEGENESKIETKSLEFKEGESIIEKLGIDWLDKKNNKNSDSKKNEEK